MLVLAKENDHFSPRFVDHKQHLGSLERWRFQFGINTHRTNVHLKTDVSTLKATNYHLRVATHTSRWDAIYTKFGQRDTVDVHIVWSVRLQMYTKFGQ